MLLGRLLVSVAQVLDIVFKGRPNALLAFVMIVCPLLMNMAQLLVCVYSKKYPPLCVDVVRVVDVVCVACVVYVVYGGRDT